MPRIKTTPTVRIALWAIRIYLLVLLTLIGLKFVRVYTHAPKPPDSTAPAPAGQASGGVKP
jgi:hypothetical protein